MTKKITQDHCQQCGSTDSEHVGLYALQENDGYSACCNELIVWGGCNETCTHADEAATRDYYVIRTEFGYLGTYMIADAELRDDMPAQFAYTFTDAARAEDLALDWGGEVIKIDLATFGK